MKRILGILILSFLPSLVLACPSCFSNGAQATGTEGVNEAILAMIGITGFVLGGIGSFFIVLRRRIKRVSQIERSASVSVNKKGVLEWSNS